MSWMTSSSTILPEGKMKNGFSPFGHTKVYPICIHLMPTDSTAGVFSSRYGSTRSSSSSTSSGRTSLVGAGPLAVLNVKGRSALLVRCSSPCISRLPTRSKPHPVSISHSATLPVALDGHAMGPLPIPGARAICISRIRSLAASLAEANLLCLSTSSLSEGSLGNVCVTNPPVSGGTTISSPNSSRGAGAASSFSVSGTSPSCLNSFHLTAMRRIAADRDSCRMSHL